MLLEKKRALPLLALVGIALAILLIKLQPKVQHNPQASAVTPVSVINITRAKVRPSIRGFGVVEPDVLLSLKAEIAGKVVYVHPQLRKGAMLPANTPVVRIDDKDYQLALKQAKADLVSSQASLKELKLNWQDAKKDLQLAQKKLQLAQQEYDRMAALVKQGLASQTALDSENTKLLQTKQEVQNLSNRVSILPAQQEVLDAKIVIAQSTVETQQRNLERTEILLPFNARIDAMDVVEGQFVSAGNTLFAAQDISKVLINAQFPLDRFQVIAKGFAKYEKLLRSILMRHDSTEMFQKLGLTATVKLAGNHNGSVWQAKVERISNTLDPQTRTLGIIVSVINSYENVEPGTRPPLITGMYTEVNLHGIEQDYYPVPRSALHEQLLYLVGDGNRLQTIAVSPDHQQDQLALFSQGISEGQQLIVSDLFPAVPGMPLAPQHDAALQQQLMQWTEEMD